MHSRGGCARHEARLRRDRAGAGNRADCKRSWGKHLMLDQWKPYMVERFSPEGMGALEEFILENTDAAALDEAALSWPACLSLRFTRVFPSTPRCLLKSL